MRSALTAIYPVTRRHSRKAESSGGLTLTQIRITRTPLDNTVKLAKTISILDLDLDPPDR